MFDAYLSRRGLVPDGDPIVTSRSRLLPVRRGDEPGMLKVVLEEEEPSGNRLMRWWGAARVLAYNEEARNCQEFRAWRGGSRDYAIALVKRSPKRTAN